MAKDNIVSLREHFERCLLELREKNDLQFKLIKEASDLALSALNERLGRMNEFRDAMKDQANTFITKFEITSVMNLIDKNSEDIKILREAKSKAEGKALSANIMAIISLVITLIMAFLKVVAVI